MDKLEQVIDAAKKLEAAHVDLLNRQLASEAMLHAVLQLVDAPALDRLRDEYEQGLDRLASQLAPNLQRPALWSDFAKAIQERADYLARRASGKPQ